MNLNLIIYLVVLLVILFGTIFFLYRKFKKRRTKKLLQKQQNIDPIEEMFNKGDILLPSKKEDFENFEEFRRKTFDNDIIQEQLNEIDVNSEYER